MLTKCLTTIPDGSRPQAIGGRSAKDLGLTEIVIWSVLHGDMQPRKRAMSSDHSRTYKDLGVPFNIAQYSLLTHMVAHQLDCKAKEFIWFGGDVHIYENHVDQVREQLKKPILESPLIAFKRKPEDIFSYRFDDFDLKGYVHADYVPAEVSPQGQPGKGVRLL